MCFNQNFIIKLKGVMPTQAPTPTAVRSRGKPAQPAYPAVYLESTTRATRVEAKR